MQPATHQYLGCSGLRWGSWSQWCTRGVELMKYLFGWFQIIFIIYVYRSIYSYFVYLFWHPVFIYLFGKPHPGIQYNTWKTRTIDINVTFITYVRIELCKVWNLHSFWCPFCSNFTTTIPKSLSVVQMLIYLEDFFRNGKIQSLSSDLTRILFYITNSNLLVSMSCNFLKLLFYSL